MSFIIAQRIGGEAVGKFDIAQIRAPEICALKGIVGEHFARGNFILNATEHRGGIDKPLSRKAARIKAVGIQLTADTAVGVTAAAPAVDYGKIGGIGALKLGAYARVKNPVPADEPVIFDYSAVQGMQCRANELTDSAGRNNSVAVEREKELYAV